MSRWLIKANDPYRLNDTSNVPLEDPSKQVEEEPYGYEKNENKWETEQEKNNAK